MLEAKDNLILQENNNNNNLKNDAGVDWRGVNEKNKDQQ